MKVFLGTLSTFILKVMEDGNNNVTREKLALHGNDFSLFFYFS